MTSVDLNRFIDETEFSGYQQITLPDGRVIPGADRAPLADLIFSGDLTGKSVLDVGCYYGFFLHDAIRRGARRVVGVEADAERFRIARTLADAWGGKVEIHPGLLEEIELSETFDIVLFLNVLHHVKDPLQAIRRLASLCKGTLIVELRQPHDPQFIQECFGRPRGRGADKPSIMRRVSSRLRVSIETRLMELATKRLPIIGVGSVEYHRACYFSQAGFRNLFQVHNEIFRHVEFRPSLTRGQTLAICDCT